MSPVQLRRIIILIFFFAILHGQEYAFMSWMDHTNFQDAVLIFANNQKQMNF